MIIAFLFQLINCHCGKRVGWVRCLCTLRKTCYSYINLYIAIHLFHKTPCSPCSTILFSTKLVCSECMCRLVFSFTSYFFFILLTILTSHTKALLKHNLKRKSLAYLKRCDECVSTKLGVTGNFVSSFHLLIQSSTP